MIRVITGDAFESLLSIEDCSVDSIVTDPPYGLTSARPGGRSPATEGAVMKGFMGLAWDGAVPGYEVWQECLRVLKPGGYLLAFAGTRTQHRMATEIEDAGFEIRDMIAWLYGSGFPKSRNLDGDWHGWGSALKPAMEPITVARKPLIGTVAANVQAHGTGAMNIDGCRVGTDPRVVPAGSATSLQRQSRVVAGYRSDAGIGPGSGAHSVEGRWPANVIHDGSDEVLAAFPDAPGQMATESSSSSSRKNQTVYGAMARGSAGRGPRAEVDKSAARFFYCAKASRADRGEGNNHPTVKPTALMRYLVRLVTPPGGTVLDPFAGSGSTLLAAAREGFNAIGIERDPAYADMARRRIAGDAPLLADVA